MKSQSKVGLWSRAAAVLGFVSLLGVGSSVAAVPGNADDVKIGTVDMQQALQSVEAGKQAKAQLEKIFNSKKQELQSEEAAIKKAVEELQKQASVMNEAALAKKQAELQQRIVQFQEKTARSQAEIQQKEQQLTEPIINKLRGIVSNMAKKKGYTVVLEKNENAVLFSQEKDDLTQDVIKAFNQQKS